MPEKPTVELGVIDYPRNEVITEIAGPEVKSSEDLKYEKIKANASVRKPLSSYDKAVCFVPDAWVPVQTYMHLLENYIKTSCTCN